MRKRFISVLLAIAMTGILVVSPVFADMDYDELGEIFVQNDTEEGLSDPVPEENSFVFEDVTTDTNVAEGDTEATEEAIENPENEEETENNTEDAEEPDENSTEDTVSPNDAISEIIEEEEDIPASNNDAERIIEETISDNSFEDDGETVSDNEIEEIEEDGLRLRGIFAEVDGHTITVSGNLPEGAVLIAKKLSRKAARKTEDIVNEGTDEFQSFIVYDAFDIEILTEDGEVWQPVDDGEAVSVQISGVDVSEQNDENELNVYRIEDNEDEATLLSGRIADEEEGVVIFETEHFTVFTIGSTEYDTDDATSSWDVSKAGDGSIKAYWYADSKTIVINGTGAIKDYYTDNNPLLMVSNGVSKTTDSDGHEFPCVEKVVISPGITKIGSDSFTGCRNLTTDNLLIPDSVTEIGSSAFADCSGLTGTLTIPGGVRTIDIDAFAYTGITKLIMSDNVETIDSQAFCECHELTELVLSDSVTTIESDAFWDCNHLTKITGGNNVTSVAAGAFTIYDEHGTLPLLKTNLTTTSDALLNRNWTEEGRKLAKEVTINGVTYDLADADYSWKVGENITLYYYNATAEEDYKMLLYGTGDMYSTDFTGDPLRLFTSYFSTTPSVISRKYDIVLSDGITSIGEGAFSSLTNIKSINIPTTVTSIGNYAFSTSKVTGENGNDTITIPGSVEVISAGVFNRTNFKNVVLSSGTKRIEDYAFLRSQIESIDLPDSLEYIGENAFKNCPYLTEIQGGDNVSTVKDNAFMYSKSDCESEFMKAFPAKLNTTLTTSSTVLNGYNWSSSNRKIVGARETWEIGNGTDTITAEWDPDTATLTISGNGAIKDFDETPFDDIKDEENITVVWGKNPTHIGNNLFNSLTGIKEITIPPTVTSVGEKAYYGLNEVTTITFKGTTITTGDNAFTATTTDPIDTLVVTNCTAFKKQTANGGWTAFNRNVNTSTHSATWDISKTEDNSLTAEWNSETGTLLIVGNGEMKDFGTGESPISDVLSDFAFDVAFNDSPVNIGANAFEDCTRARFTSLPESITKISGLAFNGCDPMPNVDLPSEMRFKASDGAWDYDNTYNNLSELARTDGDLYYLEEGVTVTLPMSFSNDATGSTVAGSIPVSLQGIALRDKELTITPSAMSNGTETAEVTISSNNISKKQGSFSKNYDGYDENTDKATIGYSFTASKAGLWSGTMTVTLADAS